MFSPRLSNPRIFVLNTGFQRLGNRTALIDLGIYELRGKSSYEWKLHGPANHCTEEEARQHAADLLRGNVVIVWHGLNDMTFEFCTDIAVVIELMYRKPFRGTTHQALTDVARLYGYPGPIPGNKRHALAEAKVIEWLYTNIAEVDTVGDEFYGRKRYNMSFR